MSINRREYIDVDRYKRWEEKMSSMDKTGEMNGKRGSSRNKCEKGERKGQMMEGCWLDGWMDGDIKSGVAKERREMSSEGQEVKQRERLPPIQLVFPSEWEGGASLSLSSHETLNGIDFPYHFRCHWIPVYCPFRLISLPGTLLPLPPLFPSPRSTPFRPIPDTKTLQAQDTHIHLCTFTYLHTIFECHKD